MKILAPRLQKIISIIEKKNQCGIGDVLENIDENISQPTLNRDIASLVAQNILERIGQGRSTKYQIHPDYRLFASVDLQAYFTQLVDQRSGHRTFQFEIFDRLSTISLFTDAELNELKKQHQQYQKRIKMLSSTILQKEFERLTIELSWKSSQIEGNTYSLLETERLLKEKKEAPNHTREEAMMLLNHKSAFDFIQNNAKSFSKISIAKIEHIHAILIQSLNVSKNIRSHGVGITGTFYKPLDNQHQIREAVQSMCDLINQKKNIFEKAFLSVVLIAYIQPFEDGNKRTSRLTANAILLANNACPLSYRSVDESEYKKALILFHEQQNISSFKDIFLQQTFFAMQEYFL